MFVKAKLYEKLYIRIYNCNAADEAPENTELRDDRIRSDCFLLFNRQHGLSDMFLYNQTVYIIKCSFQKDIRNMKT